MNSGNLSLIIDGRNFTDSVQDINKLKLGFGLNESTKTIGYTISEGLTITGDGYNYLFNKFFADCRQGILSDATSVITISRNGGRTIPFVINSRALTHDPCNCSIEFRLQSDSIVNRCHEYFNTTLIGENGFDDAYVHPKKWFATQGGFMHNALYVLRPLILVILLVVLPAIKLIRGAIFAICNVINFLPRFLGVGIDCPDIPQIPDFGDISESYDLLIAGNGKYNPSPLLREIFEYHAKQCGLNFRSSIFNDPSSDYYNDIYFKLEAGKHGSITDDVNFIPENYGLDTIIDVLDFASSVYNADYRIVGNELILERVDYFYRANDPTFSIVDYYQRGLIKECPKYRFNPTNLSSYLSLQYSQDGLDREGNRVIDLYKDKIDWNNPPSASQKGKSEKLIPASPSRFQYDRESFIDSFLDFDVEIDNFRSGSAILFRPRNPHRTRDLIIDNDQTSVPKVIGLISGFNRNDAFAKRLPLLRRDGRQFYLYNYNLMVDESMQIGEPDLYNNQFIVDNPRTGSTPVMEVDGSFTTDLTDEIWDAILSQGVDMSFNTHHGIGKANEVEIDLDNCSVTFSNVDIVC